MTGVHVSISTSSESSDAQSDRNAFRLKNILYGNYLSSDETDNSVPQYILKDIDTDDASQCFRLFKNSVGKTVLNSADKKAEYSLSFCSTDTEKSVLKVKNDDAEAISLLKDSNGLYKITVSSDEARLYLSTGADGSVFFSETCDTSSIWSVEYIIPETFSMAYFETRVKLYSVHKISLNIKPYVLTSFVTWTADDESILLVSNDGTLCALAEGETTVSASIGDLTVKCKVEVCTKDAYTWYSQTNINNSYWNGAALSGIKFKKRPFASESVRDWMNQGCAISSVAMVFHNMGATYTNGYDFRSGQSGDLPADPYTVALANVGFSGFSAPTGTYYADPIYTRWSTVTKAFKLNGKDLTYTHKYSGNRNTIKNALLKNPEGIVVQMTKSDGDTHYIVITECINPEETKASKLRFIVYDPLSYDGSDGDGVPFEDSASYKLGYRYSDFTSFYFWDVE